MRSGVPTPASPASRLKSSSSLQNVIIFIAWHGHRNDSNARLYGTICKPNKIMDTKRVVSPVYCLFLSLNFIYQKQGHICLYFCPYFCLSFELKLFLHAQGQIVPIFVSLFRTKVVVHTHRDMSLFFRTKFGVFRDRERDTFSCPSLLSLVFVPGNLRNSLTTITDTVCIHINPNFQRKQQHTTPLSSSLCASCGTFFIKSGCRS